MSKLSARRRKPGFSLPSFAALKTYNDRHYGS